MVIDYVDDNMKSLLVQLKDTGILGGQSKTVYLSNLTILYPANPYLEQT